MGCVKVLLSFLLVFTLTNLVQSKKMCDLDNVECLTKGAKAFYKTLIAGANGIEPLDPIRIDKFEGEAPGVKYTISNGTMSELKSCEVTKLKSNKKESAFEFSLLCPQLILNFVYEVKGFLGTLPVDGAAEEKVTIDDYFIVIKGKHVIYVSEKDKKPRGEIKSFVIDTEPRGKFTFETINLIRGDKKKVEDANAFANENWRAMEKVMKSPLMENLFKSVVDKTNMHMKEVPLEDILTEE